MDNIKMNVEGDELVIRVNLKAPTTPSASGKTDVIASSRGAGDVPGQPGVKLNLNLYRSRK